jgi:pyrimidine deaminase RibD-like protein
LKEAIEQLQKAEELELYRDAYEKAHGALNELIRLIPVIVEIKSATPSTEEPKGIEAIPDWMIHHYRLGREKLFIFASPEIPLEPGRYYLPPKWRKGNRILYVVSDTQPLLHVRYQPQWKFWEKEAANASLLLIEGISFKHLERAIALAEKCVSEDEETHPKVGAVIVKEGKIVSESYRNEDGKGGHAEEIAIKGCRKEDLKGATIISTLEPCTTGRHQPNWPCANLIIFNGIQKVVIGMLDPNRDIRGSGEVLFRQNNISVAYFPSRLSAKIWRLNEDFIKYHTEDDFRTVYLYKQ